ncbi:MAG TPA: hypothetical protein VHB21_16875 [Minicystis sp.]|nr:hypothetical protein [Minicystis sp.]
MQRRFLAAACVLGLAAGAGSVVSCGARSELEAPGAEGGGGSGGHRAHHHDGGPDAPPPEDCVEAGVTYVYLVTETNSLLAFYPPSLSVSKIGAIDCPAKGGATPFSMGVDRAGIAYVVFDDGELFRVSPADASCSPTPFVPGQHGFTTFGMGFSADMTDPGETLFVSQIDFAGSGASSKGLATIDTSSFELSFIGPYSADVGAMELTGTGDGRLFGYALKPNGAGGAVLELDKQTAAILSRVPLPVGDSSSALAFAFWGGDFYIFTTNQGGGTDVTRYRPADGAIDVVATIGEVVVGAGVSTCAPSH